MHLYLTLLLMVFCSWASPIAAQEPIIKRGAAIDIRPDETRETVALNAKRGETVIRVPVRYGTLVKAENDVVFTGGLVKGNPVIEAGAFLYLTEVKTKYYPQVNSLKSVNLQNLFLCAAPSSSQKRKFSACFTVESIGLEQTAFVKAPATSWLAPSLVIPGYFGGSALQITGPVTENPFPDLAIEVQVSAWRSDSMSWRMLLGGQRLATGESTIVDGKAVISLFDQEFTIAADGRGSFTTALQRDR